MAEKAAPLPLSAVAVCVEKEEEEEEEKKKHAPADPRFPSVPHVIEWALLNAGNVFFSVFYALSMPLSWLLPRVEMPDAEVAVAVALAAVMVCCAVSQAAAGALALRLPRQRRLVLAYAALVATAAGHCMWAGLYSMFVFADPEGLSFMTGVTIGVIFFSGDLICFRGLIFVGGGEDEEEEEKGTAELAI